MTQSTAPRTLEILFARELMRQAKKCPEPNTAGAFAQLGWHHGSRAMEPISC